MQAGRATSPVLVRRSSSVNVLRPDPSPRTDTGRPKSEQPRKKSEAFWVPAQDRAPFSTSQKHTPGIHWGTPSARDLFNRNPK